MGMKVYVSNIEDRGFVRDFVTGLRVHGVLHTETFAHADFAIMGGLHDTFLIDECKRTDTPFLVTDLGYLKRANDRDRTGYHQVGWNRLCWIPTVELGPDRWEALGLRLRDDEKPKGNRWVIAGQVPEDNQHGLDSEQLGWRYVSYAEAIIRKDPDAEIIFRTHPHAPILPQSLLSPTGNLHRAFDDVERQVPVPTSLLKADRVVCFNSTFFYDSYLAGVPVFCDPEAHYASEAAGDILDIERGRCELYDVSTKTRFLSRVAYAQWTHEEAKKGTAWDFLREFAA